MNKKVIHRVFKIIKRRFLLNMVEIGIITLLLLVIYNRANPLKVEISYSTLIQDSNGDVFHTFLSKDDKWRMYIEPHEISPLLKKAFLEKEDKYFYYHPGVNPLAMARAFFNNVIQGKRTSGASTITMQVVRLLHPRKRTYSSKFIEMVEAFQLEMNYTKEEILSLYLNLVPYGGNIEGVKSMAILYLDKMPEQLSLSECVALSIIPNRPNSLRPGKFNDKINVAKNVWLNRFKEQEVFDQKIIESALDEDFVGKRKDTPQGLPHLSWRLKKAYPNSYNLTSTIRLDLQKKAEKLMKSYSKSLSYQGINNASLMVIDNRTREVVTYIGSQNFHDSKNAGQVDGIRAVRSPGSTLKPFLYGLAIESGLITPMTRLMDVPLNFQGYEPENYDGEFHGSITANNALASSLNLPAVRLLDEFTTKAFAEKLEKAGFRQIAKDKNKLGLSLILGGCGVSMEELCALYSSFANDGVLERLRFTDIDPTEIGKDSLLSADANYLMSKIMLDVSRPDLPGSWRNASNLPEIAWKTGTSYGRKDAWSIGFNKNYTIGVWVGNFDNRGVPEMSGSSSAAPLLFQLFNALDHNSSKGWLNNPHSLEFRQVCSVTGSVPSEHCENNIVDYFLPGISNNQKCDHLKKIWVNVDSTATYCTTCRPEEGYVEALYPHYPSELVSWYEHRNVNYTKMPPHYAECERIFTDNQPRITSPVQNLTYHLDIIDSTEITLACQAYNDVNKVYWYVNDHFLQEAEPNEQIFIFPKAGELQISCVDDKGRKTMVESFVKYANF